MKIINPEEVSNRVPTNEKFIERLEAEINHFLTYKDYAKDKLEISEIVYDGLNSYKKWFNAELEKSGWKAKLIQQPSSLQDQRLGGYYIEFSPLGNLPLDNSTLYKLIRTDSIGYGEYDSVLIRANNLEQAWELAEAFNISPFNAFSVEIKEKGDPEVIISSFNAG